jgi:4-hydroxybenzoate adenylyltransferase
VAKARAENVVERLMARCTAKGWTELPAVVGDGRTISHGEVYDGALRFASLLASSGLMVGDRVLIAVRDGLEFVWAFLGALYGGQLAIPVDPGMRPDEHARLAHETGASLVVAHADLLERFSQPSLAAEDLAPRLLRERGSLLPSASVVPAYAQLTSGTTGPPKIVVHKHADPEVFHQAFGRPVLSLRPGEVVFSASKMFFAYGLGNSLLYPLMSGATTVLYPSRSSAEVIADVVSRNDVDVLFGVPSVFARMLAGRHGHLLRGLRLAISAGEALPAAVEEGFAEETDVPLLNGLGCTEVGQTFSSNAVTSSRSGTVGRALAPYRISLVDELARPIARGREGLIRVHGPTLPIGRLEGGSLVRHSGLRALTTNDLAVQDRDGYIHYRTRVDNVQVIGGLKVRPEPIEETLRRHEGVLEAAVAAVTDAAGVARLRAYVVGGQAEDRDVFASALLRSVAAHHAPHEVPRSVQFLNVLPRTATGKLKRFALAGAARTATDAREHALD